MNNIVYALVAVGLGVAISFQPPINALMGRALGSPSTIGRVNLNFH